MEFPLGELTAPSVEVLMERKRRLIALHLQGAPREVREGIEAAMAGERLTPAQGLALYRHAPPPLLSLAASYTRLRLNGLSTYYNRNGHIDQPVPLPVQFLLISQGARASGGLGTHPRADSL